MVSTNILLVIFALLSTYSVQAFINHGFGGLNVGIKSQLVPVTPRATNGVSLSMMANDEDELKKVMRSARKAGANDRVVDIKKPLGLVLEEDEKGNVYVAAINSGGNADRTRKVEVGDKIVMISATFGDELWSTRGVGLASIMKAVQVRAAPTCKVVLESAEETSAKAGKASIDAATRKAKQEEEKAKRDRLLRELEETDKKIAAKKKFFGLF